MFARSALRGAVLLWPIIGLICTIALGFNLLALMWVMGLMCWCCFAAGATDPHSPFRKVQLQWILSPFGLVALALELVWLLLIGSQDIYLKIKGAM